MSRPTMDELKLKRDGWLGYGTKRDVFLRSVGEQVSQHRDPEGRVHTFIRLPDGSVIEFEDVWQEGE